MFTLNQAKKVADDHKYLIGTTLHSKNGNTTKVDHLVICSVIGYPTGLGQLRQSPPGVHIYPESIDTDYKVITLNIVGDDITTRDITRLKEFGVEIDLGKY